MANEVYNLYKQDILQGTADRGLTGTTAATDAPHCALVGNGYSFSHAHELYSSLTDIRGTDQQITVPSVSTTGTFTTGTAFLTYTAVASGTAINFLIIYRRAPTLASSPLVLKIDTATNLPVVPNGGNITVTWATTPNPGNIFTISDVRVKRDIRQVGTLDNGLGVYEYRYEWSDEPWRGLIAQEVERLVPEAVAEFNGIKAVNYLKAGYYD